MKAFVTARAKSFGNAGRGIGVFFARTPNAWIQLGAFLAVLALGLYFRIAADEWSLVILAAALVFATEAINTAIEIDIDRTSPEYHPFARDTKDVAAGAVLIASLGALAIGLLVFGPRLLALML